MTFEEAVEVLKKDNEVSRRIDEIPELIENLQDDIDRAGNEISELECELENLKKSPEWQEAKQVARHGREEIETLKKSRENGILKCTDKTFEILEEQQKKIEVLL